MNVQEITTSSNHNNNSIDDFISEDKKDEINRSLLTIDSIESDDSNSEEDYFDPVLNLDIPISVDLLPRGYLSNPNMSFKNLNNYNKLDYRDETQALISQKEDQEDSDDEETGFYYVCKIKDDCIKRKKDYPILSCIIANGVKD